MSKKRLSLFIVLTIFLFLSVGLQAQLCVPASTYDALAWTWEYLGPCSTSYNCLGYATGSMYWEWPWGSNLPTSNQVVAYLGTKGYSLNGTTSKIVSYGTTGGIKHFSKITGPTVCEAKCGSLNLLKHYSWDPYHHSGDYGGKVNVYKTGGLIVRISGPTKCYNDTTYTWCANAEGGTPPYSYEWHTEEYTGPTDNRCLSQQMPDALDLPLMVIVTDANNNTAQDTHFVRNMDSMKIVSQLQKPQEGELKRNIDQLMFSIRGTGLSPNPYNYIENDAFRKVVAMGPEAVELINKELIQSKNNGLREYLLAIAAEKIMGVDLKTQSIQWTSGKNWPLSWSKFTSILQIKVESLVSSGLSAEKRDPQLEALGIGILPVLQKKIAKGELQLKPVFNKLMEKTGDFTTRRDELIRNIERVVKKKK